MTNSAHIARECASTITNSQIARSPPATEILPTYAQSTCACSPGSVSVIKYAARLGRGRTSATYLRNVRTEPR